MKKSMKYKILIAQKTIVAYYTGDISVEDLMAFKMKMSKDVHYDPSYHLILDFRNCNLTFEVEAVAIYVDFLKKNKNITATRRTVFLADKPNEVVLATLFESRKGSLPIATAIFVTLEAATNWLFDSSANFGLLEAALGELRTGS